MSIEPSYQTHLNKSRELIDMVDRLTREYAELRELSRVLRRESRQLRDDSYALRRMLTGLIPPESP